MIFIFDSSVAKYLQALGIVIWPFVFIAPAKDDTPPSLLKHEFVHVHQVRREGVIWFYAQYIWCLICHWWKYGDWEGGFVNENKWEDEAYSLEVNPLTDDEIKESGWTGAKTDRIWKGLRTKMNKKKSGK